MSRKKQETNLSRDGESKLKQKKFRMDSKARERKIAELEIALSIWANVTTACQHIGVDRTTYYYWLRSWHLDPVRVEQLRAKPMLKALKTIYDNLSDGETAKWYLERVLKDQFSKRSEVTWRDWEPISPTKIVIVNPTQDKKEDVEDAKIEE